MSEVRAKVVEFKLENHPNADSLSIANIKDSAWQCIVRTEDFKNKKLGVYIPLDAEVPTQINGEKTQFYFLDKKETGKPHRVKTIRLRGALSQGLLVAAPEGSKVGDDFTEEWGVTRYEPPIPVNLRGGRLSRQPAAFRKFASAENRKNYPNILKEGEDVIISEKIHGSNLRMSYIHDGKYVSNIWIVLWNFLATIFGFLGMKKKVIPKLEFYVGSNNVAKKLDDDNDYVKAAKKYNLENKMKPLLEKYNVQTNFILYGELYGWGVQNLTYNCKKNEQKVAIFDVMIDNKYQPWEIVEEICKELDLETVPVLYRGPFSHEQTLTLQDGPTVIGSRAHMREGVVVRPEPERWDPKIGRVTIKYISDAYLEKQSKNPKATDGH